MTFLQSISVRKAKKPLKGIYEVPGDKSISHRSLLINAMVPGTVTINNLNRGDDVACSLNAIQNLGVMSEKSPNHSLILTIPPRLFVKNPTFWLGNSGTTARLLCGVLSHIPIQVQLSGDESLHKRPMNRVIDPLSLMGVESLSSNKCFLPLCLKGSTKLRSIDYTMPVASAQVKSAIMVAALRCYGGQTVIRESTKTRDHTERLLQSLGLPIVVETSATHQHMIMVKAMGMDDFPSKDRYITVPGDASAAAFWAVAACIVPESSIIIKGICLNESRTGFIDILKKMGANITISNQCYCHGEQMGDLHVSYSHLEGVHIPSNQSARTIDEYPILAVAAAMAKGKTVFEGLKELRVKESDRLRAIAHGLDACGICVDVKNDTLTIFGSNGQGIATQDAVIDAQLDHRIAMSFSVFALASGHEITIIGHETVTTSFPTFYTQLFAING